MGYSDEYRDLIRDAQSAIYDLLKASTPDSWMHLRRNYGDLREALERDDSERRTAEPEPEIATTNEPPALRSDFHAWKTVPKAQRVHIILNVLGDEQLRVRDLAARVQPQVAEATHHPTACVLTWHLQPMLYELLESGDLDRRQVPAGPKARNWVYFRRAGLDPEIAQLQEAFDASEDC